MQLVLDSSFAVVWIDVTFTALATGATRFVSTEVFRFKGWFRKLIGLFARRAIRSAHRRHMEGFKQFVEMKP